MLHLRRPGHAPSSHTHEQRKTNSLVQSCTARSPGRMIEVSAASAADRGVMLMLRSSKYVFVGLLLTAVFAVMPSRAEAQAGIKGGFLYSTLKFEDTEDVFDSHNGWTAGVFFGTKGDKIVGVQGEVNVLQKGGAIGSTDLKLYYLQVPVLLRVGGGSTVNVYGLIGPSFDIKVAEKVEDVAFVDEFEGVDVSLTGGVGVEVRSEERRVGKEGRARWRAWHGVVKG